MEFWWDEIKRKELERWRQSDNIYSKGTRQYSKKVSTYSLDFCLSRQETKTSFILRLPVQG